jgi:hypothetical protein
VLSLLVAGAHPSVGQLMARWTEGCHSPEQPLLLLAPGEGGEGA